MQGSRASWSYFVWMNPTTEKFGLINYQLDLEVEINMRHLIRLNSICNLTIDFSSCVNWHWFPWHSSPNPCLPDILLVFVEYYFDTHEPRFKWSDQRVTIYIGEYCRHFPFLAISCCSLSSTPKWLAPTNHWISDPWQLAMSSYFTFIDRVMGRTKTQPMLTYGQTFFFFL